MIIFNGFNSQKIQRPEKGLKKIIFLVSILVGTLILIMAVYFFAKVNLPFSSEDSELNFRVEKGNSTKEVAKQLRESNLINNPFIFVLNAILNNAGGRLQAGDYILNRNMSIAEILDRFTVGNVVRDEKIVTIIEGWSNKQIKENFESSNIFSAAQFDAALKEAYEFKYNSASGKNYEGFLFPDTYLINKDAEASDLIQKMLKNFESKFNQDLVSDLEKNNLNLADVVILASIVEKEVGRNKKKITEEDREEMQKERELVASVFYNRLAINQRLESDATVNYVTGKKDRQALISDTKIDSPYNTYQVTGLPPGPIGNPGLGALKAVLNPANSDYFYFINKTNGEAVFGKTLKEHNENRAKHLD